MKKLFVLIVLVAIAGCSGMGHHSSGDMGAGSTGGYGSADVPASSVRIVPPGP